MRRYALRDDQWERIKDLLPGREGHVGVTAKDNRLFVEAVLYRYRAGIPWRDLPERFGDPWLADNGTERHSCAYICLAVKFAIAHAWITMPSGAYLMFTQAGANLFRVDRDTAI
jgi:hypothetical protein